MLNSYKKILNLNCDMNAKEAFSFLQELEGKGIKLGLQRIEKAVKLLNIPKEIIFVKVAGTNGKGSTATFISSILQQAGYNTGLYLSPHVVEFAERIQLNSNNIPEKELIKQIEAVKKINEENSLELTYFEFITFLALKYFMQEKCNAIVLEIGMGGRLDATNVVKGKINVITNVSLEHEEFLGHSIEKIASEKAGVIDQNAVVVTGEEKKQVLEIFRKICAERNAKLLGLNEDFSWDVKEKNLKKTVFDFKDKEIEFKGLEVGFAGKHFVVNAVLAMEGALNLGVGEEEIRKGLLLAKMVGRFQVLQKKPLVIVDCAHNPAGIETLVESVDDLIGKKVNLVFGCSDDKDYSGMVEKIANIAKSVYCTQAKYRGLDAEIIRKEFEENGIQCEIERDVKKAVEKALKQAEKEDVVLVCGSCFVAGEALHYF